MGKGDPRAVALLIDYKVHSCELENSTRPVEANLHLQPLQDSYLIHCLACGNAFNHRPARGSPYRTRSGNASP